MNARKYFLNSFIQRLSNTKKSKLKLKSTKKKFQKVQKKNKAKRVIPSKKSKNTSKLNKSKLSKIDKKSRSADLKTKKSTPKQY